VARVTAFAVDIGLNWPLSAVAVRSRADRSHTPNTSGLWRTADSPHSGWPDMKKQESSSRRRTENCSRTIIVKHAGPGRTVARGHMTEETPTRREWKAAMYTGKNPVPVTLDC